MDLRATLRQDLKDRMRARDTRAVEVLRVAIAAIKNAEAQPLDAESVGTTEVARKVVSEKDARAIVARELDDLLAAARQYDALGERAAAEDLKAQAEVLRRILSE